MNRAVGRFERPLAEALNAASPNDMGMLEAIPPPLEFHSPITTGIPGLSERLGGH
jgi:hypothetical protein